MVHHRPDFKKLLGDAPAAAAAQKPFYLDRHGWHFINQYILAYLRPYQVKCLKAFAQFELHSLCVTVERRTLDVPTNLQRESGRDIGG
jgi:hypothetical protein